FAVQHRAVTDKNIAVQFDTFLQRIFEIIGIGITQHTTPQHFTAANSTAEKQQGYQANRHQKIRFGIKKHGHRLSDAGTVKYGGPGNTGNGYQQGRIYPETMTDIIQESIHFTDQHDRKKAGYQHHKPADFRFFDRQQPEQTSAQ